MAHPSPTRPWGRPATVLSVVVGLIAGTVLVVAYVMAQVDVPVVQRLNAIARTSLLRPLAVVSGEYFVAIPVALLAGLGLVALWRRRTPALASLVVAGIGGAVALGLNKLANAVWFRPRPYNAIANVHALVPKVADSSFFSDHATVVAACAVGVALVAWRWFPVALAFAAAVAVGRVAVGAHYPSDVLTGLVVGTASVVAFLPARARIERCLARLPGLGQPARAPVIEGTQELLLAKTLQGRERTTS